MRKFLALGAAFATLAAGCAVDTKRPSNVTSTSATLNASVLCDPGTKGSAWWELREADGAWRLASPKATVACESSRTLRVTRNVNGLQAGTRYQYRTAADPGSPGGRVLRSGSTSFTTDLFSPGLVASGVGVSPGPHPRVPDAGPGGGHGGPLVGGGRVADLADDA